MNVIVHENADGTVAITTMAPNFVAAEHAAGKTDVQILAEHEARLASDYPTVTVHGNIDPGTLPDGAGSHMEYILDEVAKTVSQQPYADQRRCFRNAWVWNGSAVVEDATKMGDLKKERARAVRNRLLELSDAPMMQITEQAGPLLAAYRTYRQDLRDLGTAIDADPDNVIFPAVPV